MRSVTSEQLVENFVKMLAEHFTVSTEWHQRLMGSVQLNDLRTSISEGHLDEVNTKINQMGDVSFLININLICSLFRQLYATLPPHSF